MCLGAPLAHAADNGSSSSSVALAPTVTYFPVMAAFNPALFEKLMLPTLPALPAAGAPALPAMQDAALGSKKSAQIARHVDVDDAILGKTKLCKFYARGHCSHGRGCTFAHGRKELRPQPNLFKTEMCFEFMNGGSCHRGAACQYAHGEYELRAVMRQAPQAKSANKKHEEPRPQKGKQLNQKIVSIEREAEALRAQIRLLESQATQAVSTRSPTGSSLFSPPSGKVQSWSFDGDSQGPEPCSPGQARPAIPAGPVAAAWEEPEGTALVVQSTFLTLVPAQRAAERRSRSTPARGQ